MSLSSPIITQAILASAPDLTGVAWIRLTQVIGVAVATWAQTGIVVQGVTSGGAGSGTVTGQLILVPAPLIVPNAAALALLLGPIAGPASRAIGMGIATAFTSSASYSGASVGVGAGTDISKVTAANGPALVAALSLACTSSGIVGVTMPQICQGLGSGISSLILTATGVGVVAGAAGPIPSVGTSLSKVV